MFGALLSRNMTILLMMQRSVSLEWRVWNACVRHWALPSKSNTLSHQCVCQSCILVVCLGQLVSQPSARKRVVCSRFFSLVRSTSTDSAVFTSPANSMQVRTKDWLSYAIITHSPEPSVCLSRESAMKGGKEDTIVVEDGDWEKVKEWKWWFEEKQNS